MEKYIIDFCITNACNLKCSSCDQGCVGSNIWYSSLSDIKNWLQLIKAKCKNLRALEISGGEACLHPNFMEICQLCHELFPNILLGTTTNGTLLKKSNSELIKIKKEYNINIRVSLYPELLLNTLSLLTEKKLFNIVRLESRPIFYKDSFSLVKNDNFQKIKHHCHHLKDPTYFFSKGEFYACSSAILINQINNNLSQNNTIHIDKITTESDLLQIKQYNNLCSYCNNNKLSCYDGFYHSLNNILFNNYFETIKDLFIYQYEKYEEIFIPNSFLLNAMKNIVFLKNLKRDPANDKIFKRFYGQKDFIFLLNESSNLSYLNQFKKDNINLYFILINPTQTFASKVFDLIKNNFELEGYIYKKNNYQEAIDFINKITFCTDKKIINLL